MAPGMAQSSTVQLRNLQCARLKRECSRLECEHALFTSLQLRHAETHVVNLFMKLVRTHVNVKRQWQR
jgi:hypothetical protein